MFSLKLRLNVLLSAHCCRSDPPGRCGAVFPKAAARAGRSRNAPPRPDIRIKQSSVKAIRTRIAMQRSDKSRIRQNKSRGYGPDLRATVQAVSPTGRIKTVLACTQQCFAFDECKPKRQQKK